MYFTFSFGVLKLNMQTCESEYVCFLTVKKVFNIPYIPFRQSCVHWRDFLTKYPQKKCDYKKKKTHLLLVLESIVII